MSRTVAAALALLAGAAAGAGEFTVRSGTNFAVESSPDQQQLVIDLQGRLWVLPVAGGAATPITDGYGDDHLPRWRPDGSAIAFQTFRDGSWDLALVAPDGGSRRRLTTDPGDEREPAWTSDGRSLVYASDAAGSYDLWQLDPATGEREPLTSGPADDYAPAVAADGAVAFLSDRSGAPALWLREPDGSLRQLYRPPGRRLGQPRFSPDGTQLALVVATEELGFPALARQALQILRRSDGALVPPGLPSRDVFPFAPAWATDGRLYYTADGGVYRTKAFTAGDVRVPFTAAFEFRRAARPRPPPLAPRKREPVRGIVEPVVAPDGRAIAFAALGDLWLRAASGRVERLTDDSFVERDLGFAPDGRSLLYISDSGGTMQVWRRDLPSGASRPLTAVAGGVRYPVLAPDGRTLAFQQPGPRGDQDFVVRLLDLPTNAQSRLDTPPLWPGRMAFSADGRHLAMLVMTGASQRSREGINRYTVVGLDNAPARVAELPAGFRPEGGVTLAATGRFAVLLHDGSPWRVPLDDTGMPTGRPAELVAELADYPSITADGRRVVYLGPRGLRELLGSGGRATALPLRMTWQAPPVGDMLVRAGRLFDGTGSGYRGPLDIYVRGGRIAWIRAPGVVPAGATLIDATNDVVIPGLIENHAHHQAHDGEWVGRAWLAYGVTTVVEPGGLPYESREQREAWDSGARPGPRLVFAGPQLDGTRRYFPFASHVASRRRLEWEFERARSLGYGLLKTYTRMPPQRQAEVIARSRLVTSSHELWPALTSGGGRVEHLRGTSRAGFSTKQSDALRAYEDVLAIAGHPGASISPTLVVSGGFFDFWLRHPGLAANRAYQVFYPAPYRAGLQGFAQVVNRRGELLRAGVAEARAATLALHRGGARLVAGTDAPIFPYGLSLVVELANYVDAGLTPAEALLTATGGAADGLGLGTEIGRLAPGKLADLVVIAGDPLNDPLDLLEVRGVMRGGRYRTLEELLAAPVK
jgi:Tol biopolymer transport system component/imidazolonepropionase-like amidohydrolase